MKTLMIVCFIYGVLFFSGCGEEFIAGVGTGLAVKVNEANKVMIQLDKDIAILNEKSKELSILIKADPINVIEAVDPNLKKEVDIFIGTLNGLVSRAEEFKDKDGKISWTQVICASVISIFGGGTAVNLFKNRVA